jgi:hypothetical protein
MAVKSIDGIISIKKGIAIDILVDGNILRRPK